jgi:hypothetical protein
VGEVGQERERQERDSDSSEGEKRFDFHC